MTSRSNNILTIQMHPGYFNSVAIMPLSLIITTVVDKLSYLNSCGTLRNRSHVAGSVSKRFPRLVACVDLLWLHFLHIIPNQ